ncbi:hypothetical protein O181_107015 [Austropuccinia psidii MF-1]|uniref:Uncharacterized protein n=1 Tax=Austropuccinia psidii MF-1 TaxID=1389203 RepID=A0A9Q3JPQ0_9BASI|nr:hypothetical protein [Austropuccinia psidii MF-1]
MDILVTHEPFFVSFAAVTGPAMTVAKSPVSFFWRQCRHCWKGGDSSKQRGGTGRRAGGVIVGIDPVTRPSSVW